MEKYEKSLGHWIKRFYLLSAREMDCLLQPYELGRTQWYVMHHVGEAGTLPQKDLQSILNIESATLTPLVSALVTKGWLLQQPSHTDRRSKVLSLTKAGAEHFKAVPNPIVKARKKALTGIDPLEVEQARKMLERAVRNLEE
ncbi:MarR family winged helix-turn-helix transcriptional regulator [Marinomonas mediterranea]|jgi:Transcriptional regulators|uniref:Transcriptional regulator, MarR family n=1 Tax=Marinomonas mediterranea (strain ATCC 700492 / JCM 21426 / NBRC 103028 / MMB-1) TaxID=717774 RepID=F2JYD3_MARM1|nr:MarR family transcriptional regulator [Marinomonas mediterranea]ADZ91964.1 transcriptional regulator, MarR family [Marinomonas mediterranea MMB-1]WCN09915.1 MarR family transcriptional regulator [Marinomonas mediterranea]WCN18045.1 MarR family transcriptional regulator [Marinomonas mediterranea MMB-1]